MLAPRFSFSVAVSPCFALCLLQSLVSLIKLFPILLPDVSSASASSSARPSGASLSLSVSSPLFHLLSDLPAVKQLAGVVYLPHSAIVPDVWQAQSQQRPLDILQRLASNKQYAGHTSAAAGRAQAGGATIEEISSDSASSSSSSSAPAALPASSGAPSSASSLSLPMRHQLEHVVQDIKGSPLFDRL